jgi:hypothetical protein
LRTVGKKVKTKSPDPTHKKTKKCNALNRSLLAISRATRKIINPDIMKKI